MIQDFGVRGIGRFGVAIGAFAFLSLTPDVGTDSFAAVHSGKGSGGRTVSVDSSIHGIRGIGEVKLRLLRFAKKIGGPMLKQLVLDHDLKLQKYLRPLAPQGLYEANVEVSENHNRIVADGRVWGIHTRKSGLGDAFLFVGPESELEIRSNRRPKGPRFQLTERVREQRGRNWDRAWDRPDDVEPKVLFEFLRLDEQTDLVRARGAGVMEPDHFLLTDSSEVQSASNPLEKIFLALKNMHEPNGVRYLIRPFLERMEPLVRDPHIDVEELLAFSDWGGRKGGIWAATLPGSIEIVAKYDSGNVQLVLMDHGKRTSLTARSDRTLIFRTPATRGAAKRESKKPRPKKRVDPYLTQTAETTI